MNRSVIVRSYSEGDEKEIVPLLHLVFDGWPHRDLTCSTVDHWRWKYLDNPSRKSFIAVAVADGRIIGCHHMIPIGIRIGGNVHRCATALDFAVHPEFRGMGVSKGMDRLNEDTIRNAGIRVVYYVTRNPIVVKSAQRTNIAFPHEERVMVRIRDIDVYLGATRVENPRLVKIAFKTMGLFNNLRNSLRTFHRQDGHFHIVEATVFNDRIDEFWKRVSEHHDFIVERSSNFLNWRYCDPRAGEFVIRLAEDNRDILGYCVLAINRFDAKSPVGYLVDLLTLQQRPDVAESLVVDALKYFDENNVNVVNSLVLRRHPFERILNKYGFIDSRVRMHLFYTNLGGADIIREAGAPPDRVLLSWGDHDAV